MGIISSSPASSVVSKLGFASRTSRSNSALTLPVTVDFFSSSKINGKDSDANNWSPFVINFFTNELYSFSMANSFNSKAFTLLSTPPNG